VRIAIEGVEPAIDAGRYAVKTVAGDMVQVGVDIWKDGHDLLKAAVLFRKLTPDEWTVADGLAAPDLSQGWKEVPLATYPDWNDRWQGSFLVEGIGPYAFTFLAWTDVFGTWRSELVRKLDAGQTVTSELLEGLRLIESTAKATKGADREALLQMAAGLQAADSDPAHLRLLVLSDELLSLMERNELRADARLYPKALPLWSDRERAAFSAWYELFPRSQGTAPKSSPTKSGTLRDTAQRLPKVAAMGFDVLYLPPIHPIGVTARKGRNNTEHALPGDVGSPWAIGAKAGGHVAIHPDLGTLNDFDELVRVASDHGLEIALDFAIQCAPDHPWVKAHPEWFNQRPDGSIKYAENPPKKYQDIYPINFDTSDRDGLYAALRDVLLFWIEHGVRIFRVDNPHTKAIGFWEWVIAEIHRAHPDVLFLAEAFTRPKRMALLAKVGFTQSYSYFTWRNTKQELEDYARELFLTPVRNYLRPNFFANTPDILHAYLQEGGRPAFVNRLLLAATLGSNYGIYSGFELCENVPVRPGSEEYLDSEKYEIRRRDYDAPGNLNGLIARVNEIRRTHRALWRTGNLLQLQSTNSNVIAYAKTPPRASEGTIVVVINLDPHHVQESTIELPTHLYGDHEHGAYIVTDLLSNQIYRWNGPSNYVRLDPNGTFAHIFLIQK
jgi:starch synthase (maltosyl-transferring)